MFEILDLSKLILKRNWILFLVLSIITFSIATYNLITSEIVFEANYTGAPYYETASDVTYKVKELSMAINDNDQEYINKYLSDSIDVNDFNNDENCNYDFLTNNDNLDNNNIDNNNIDNTNNNNNNNNNNRYMDKKLKLKLNGNRGVIGILRGFDQFLNLVLDECVNDSTAEKTPLGMVVVRGASVLSMEALEHIAPVQRKSVM